MSNLPHYTVAVAGSTTYTTACAQVLQQNKNFSVPWVLTPFPRLIGRQQTLTPSPLQNWAKTEQISIINLDQQIDQSIKEKIQKKEKPDFLLVVDFGYLIPEWLLNWPNNSPLNIHPSALPKWRGSSPGQYAILNNDKHSAVSLMQVNQELDQGAVYYQQKFTIQPQWNHKDYYVFSFDQIIPLLPDLLTQIADKKLTAKPQVKTSPTKITKRIEKQDAFIDWQILASCMNGSLNGQMKHAEPSLDLNEKFLLAEKLKQTAKENWPQLIHQASKAFSPWPLLWTKIPTKKGSRRMQILKTQIATNGKLVLEKVKIAGQQTANWNQVKNILAD